jgi:RNA polymerase sigma-70 factor (ECF subfamily)
LDRHAAALTLYARTWCRQPEDVVEEAILKLVSLPEAPADVLGWMYRVVRNAAITAARAESRRKRHEAAAAEEARSWFVEGPGTSLDAETAAEALAALPVELREVVVAKIWGGLTFEQIGEACGLSSSTAHRHYCEALEQLRERLGLTWLLKLDPAH